MHSPIDPVYFSQRLYSLDVDFPVGVHTKDTKIAAVLLSLVPVNREYHVLYTKRTETVLTHKGQISFPGGMAEIQRYRPPSNCIKGD